ncbi:helix-turn-helix domain-containing protein [Cohnella silvisoli]|uniref:Helix-turn-helix transcriptional regulator n=1 Tax=Cohnella silvisoli TaxID=2873699 RepID=A0ABV1KVG5_9BACL|nr:helix-turn-helix transcriptional regulator [Cohnella silvisoli]MCD9023497.1 helix-turn-helix domain-containing protein [Cohnella silvisoli]
MNLYDKKMVGERIRSRRKALGISQENFAERIGRVTKFCADIERGQAGMSIETMLIIGSLLKLSPNDLLYGDKAQDKPNDETELIIAALNQCTEKQRKDALALLKLFITAIR